MILILLVLLAAFMARFFFCGSETGPKYTHHADLYGKLFLQR